MLEPAFWGNVSLVCLLLQPFEESKLQAYLPVQVVAEKKIKSNFLLSEYIALYS